MRKDKINCLFGQTIQEKHLLNCIQCTYSSRRTRGGGGGIKRQATRCHA